TIKGIKIAYPSNAADLKGLMKAAYYDNNPVVMLEHKGLYWSKVPGTLGAKTIEPAEDYILPFGKGNVALAASEEAIDNGESLCIITYGMGDDTERLTIINRLLTGSQCYIDRKSTRLNSSHVKISYAVFCLK